jgi:hypothetical protein
MKKTEVTAINDLVFSVDISDEACRKFGFEHKEKILDLYGRPGLVIGVAPMPESSECIDQGEDILWISLDEHNGKVCFFPNPIENLKKV